MADQFDEITRRYVSVVLRRNPATLDADMPLSRYDLPAGEAEELFWNMAEELGFDPDFTLDIRYDRPSPDVSAVTWKSLNWLAAFWPAALAARNRRTVPAQDFTLTTLAASLRQREVVDTGLNQTGYGPANTVFESLFLPGFLAIIGLIATLKFGTVSKRCCGGKLTEITPASVQPWILVAITAALITLWLCWRILPGLVALGRDASRRETA